MESVNYYINLVFGSDTQTGSTPAYVWLADQFGHIFIGFGGLFLILWVISGVTRRPLPSYGFGGVSASSRAALPGWVIWLVAAIWAAVWFRKELRDFSLAGEQAGTWLSVWTKDLVEDIATDMAFYLIGILLALAHFGVIGLRPVAVFIGTLLLAGVLVGYWLTVFDSLGKTNIPHFARMSTVKLVPQPPSAALTQAVNSGTPLPRECSLYQPGTGPALQCTVRGGCDRAHYVIYGLTDADMPPPPPPGTPAGVGHRIAMQGDAGDPKREHIRKMLPELRKLGIALVAERVFRRRDGDIYYTTLLRAVETSNPQSTLVIDNIERDLTRYALSLSSRQNDDNFNQKVPVLEALFNDELGTWRKEFAEKSVIWLSLNESLAVALCRTLVKMKPADTGGERRSADRVILIRAELAKTGGTGVASKLAGNNAAR